MLDDWNTPGFAKQLVANRPWQVAHICVMFRKAKKSEKKKKKKWKKAIFNSTVLDVHVDLSICCLQGYQAYPLLVTTDINLTVTTESIHYENMPI